LSRFTEAFREIVHLRRRGLITHQEWLRRMDELDRMMDEIPLPRVQEAVAR